MSYADGHHQEGAYDPYIPGGAPGGSAASAAGTAQGGGAPGTSRTAHIQAQIDDTVGVMRDNINKVHERGENLNALQDKTDNLVVSSRAFTQGASRVRRKMWWKDMRMRIILIIGVLCLIAVIVIPIAVKASN